MSNKWVDIPGYEGKYRISNSKRVKTVARDVKDADGNVIRRIESSEVKPKVDKLTNCKYVILHNGSKYVKEYLDDLVAKAF